MNKWQSWNVAFTTLAGNHRKSDDTIYDTNIPRNRLEDELTRFLDEVFFCKIKLLFRFVKYV